MLNGNRLSDHDMFLSSSFLMPPTIFIAVALIGALLAWRWRRLGGIVVTLSVGFLYIFSLPVVAASLLALAARAPTPAASSAQPQAIVLLTGDARWANGPGERDLPGPLTLERMLATAEQYRSRALPVLVSGGRDRRSHESLAAMTSAALTEDFGVPVRWREERSTNTFENAAFSAQILKQEGISTVIVVTQDWHMPRALWSFEQAGLAAVPAPAGPRSSGPRELDWEDFFPAPRALTTSFYACHELLGLRWYRWHYAKSAAG